MSTGIIKSRGERVRDYRTKKGWTQFDLAVRSGISPATISRIEGGIIGQPIESVVLALAEALKVPAAKIRKS